ncbi:hypothetical protein CAPTEDRAFT_158768 [Capitella teleta]|uniref:BPTI/Kunitz inhibitor domain-containing protein n=1 Tax=Capitella teleta TaxID=283909 RepID=R7T970_CAPTE|nr:hypothetical protein CAPTEDRAFT_158768 [Capitella teleta]|eukprot:ELT90278.1 hypothetical protein CAPTEDRAFT_158768 [Capitella teleta]
MREKVCGICGNFDGSAENDWVIGNSKHCMAKYPNAVPGEITADTNVMGTSWTAKMDTQEAGCVNNCPYPPPPVGCDIENGIKAEEHCDILQSTTKAFKTCLTKMTDTQKADIFDNCVFDACSVDNYVDIVCRHAASLAKICVDQYNIKVSWRSGDFCPMECEGDFMEYQACGDPCYPTCSDRAGEKCGDLGPCTEGCYCKKGYVFDGKTDCIPESSCGCEVPALGGIFINVGDSYKAEDCSESCTCEEAGADLVCEDMTCSENFVCGAKSGEPACMCEPPFILENGACIELPYPCTETETLKCFTCDTFTDDDCVEHGYMKSCDAEEPICSYQVIKNSMAVVTNVTRACASKDSCLPDSIGLGILYCEEGLDGAQVCKRCNYGDTDKDGEGDLPTADCAVAPKPTTPAPEDPCVKAADAGEGKGNLKRYYYAADEETCLKFTYKGSKGNSNNFESKEACMAACDTPAPDTCNLPADKGDGTGKTSKRFYWNPKKQVCKNFKYSGSGGNLNNFLSKKECMTACGGK